jgi:hypothetical protein
MDSRGKVYLTSVKSIPKEKESMRRRGNRAVERLESRPVAIECKTLLGTRARAFNEGLQKLAAVASGCHGQLQFSASDPHQPIPTPAGCGVRFFPVCSTAAHNPSRNLTEVLTGTTRDSDDGALMERVVGDKVGNGRTMTAVQYPMPKYLPSMQTSPVVICRRIRALALKLQHRRRVAQAHKIADKPHAASTARPITSPP